MKRNLMVGLVALLAILASPVSAQSAITAMSWWTIDAGGVQATAGSYTLRATIGQPDAARVAANWYELRAGYWPGAIVRHPRTYLPLLIGNLDIEHQVSYGQITIVALGLCLIASWRQRQVATA